MGELRDKTVSGVKWSAIGRFSTQGIGFLIGLILARLLSPADYGVVGMAGIFFAIAQTFIDSGFGSALIRKNDCTDADYSTAFYFNAVVGLLCCVILSFASPIIADFFNTPILADIVIVMSINMFIGSLSIVQGARLTAAIDFKSQAKISLITAILSGILGIAMAYNGFGVWSLVWQGVFANLLRTVLLLIITKWYPKWQFSKESFRYLFNFGSKILTASLLHTIYANMTTMIIGKYYSARDLGYYSRGESLAALPSTNITGILGSVTYPILSKIQNDDKRLIQAYRKYISMTSMVIFFGMSLLAALAKPLIVTLLTDKWTNSVIFLQVFCFALMFDHLCQLNLNILYVKGRSDLVLKLEMVKKTISIAMIITSIPFGVLAICISRAIYTQIAIVINTYYTGKLYGLGYFAQVGDFIKYLFFSLVSVLPAYLFSFTEYHSIIVLVVGTLIACVIYWLLVRQDAYFVEIVSVCISKNKRNSFVE
jgi:O-antigen/teichoic acid export membrane protein